MTTHRCRPVATALVAGFAALFLVGPAPAYAADDELRWAVQPSGPQGPGERSRFGYDLAPGQRLDDRVAITNLSRRPLTFTVYATDATTTTDGSFTLLPASRPATDAGAWIGLPRKQHTARPGQRIVLPFRLTVPANATAGDHAAGILASVVERRVDGQGQQVNVDRRVAARVYLRVTGPVRPAVQITTVRTAFDNPLLPFARGPMTVTYRVRNTGNVRVTGALSVRATGLFGVPLSGTGRRELPDLLPGAEVELAQRVDGTFPAGLVTGSVALAAADRVGRLPTQTRAAAVWTVPWTFVLVLTLMAVLVGVRAHRRRRATARAGAPGPGPVRVPSSGHD
ncbi:MAG TPA: DUF916 domain-containing protein [Catenuloplanes sp.]|jgi:hypothetical protein